MLNHTKKKGIVFGTRGRKSRIYKTWDHVACMCGKTAPVLPRPTTTNTKISQLPCAYKEINQSGNFVGLYI